MTTVRKQRKIRVGRVVSDKMDKTITVELTRTMRYPLYGRVIRKNRKLKAHDEHGEASIGDVVEVMETRPLSKMKRWRLIKIIEKSR